jgi:class 3 adenylate cyclase
VSTSSRPLPTGVVTFLFTDIEGSTRHWERTPEAMSSALARHNEIVADAVATQDGVVFKTVGDAFCAVFGDPISALKAAMDIQRTLRATTWTTDSDLQVRIGIHTGTAWSEDWDYSGPSLNRVARLMAAGHGGQILISSATQRVVEDSLPGDVGLVSLGVHHLKDLDRPEEIFQVVIAGEVEEFPPLRTVEPGPTQLAAQATAAFQAKKWEEASDLLLRLERGRPLTGAQHNMLANTLWWLGRHDEMTTRWEAAFSTYLAEGNPQSAARAGVLLSEVYTHALAPDVARAWERKAERVLESDSGTDSVARGYLLRWQTVRALEADRDLERALELAGRVMQIARNHGDGDLEALALQDLGRIRIAAGEVEQGMALMDEAMLAAIAGDVAPMTVGRSFCNMLSVCDQTGDIRRAGQWSEAAERWCSENDHGPYPGVCGIFKAELLWHKGEWTRAEAEVMRASTQLGILNDVIGEARYQYGEMRLRAGDEKRAEEAFQAALALGREPIPGYALLLARRGEVEAGIDLLDRALGSSGLTPWARARLLPTLIQLLIENADLERAESAVTELAGIGRMSTSEYFAAQARAGTGKIALAREKPAEAIEELREALRTYNTLGLPYEAALVHADLAGAYRLDGADALADMESRTAQTELERLGAVVETGMFTQPNRHTRR